MAYFKELPNILYQSFLKSKNSSLDYIEVKNLFRRVKLRDDLQNVFTMFDKYEIPEGFRPENVAEDFYGSDELDWVVLMTANIVHVRNDWPLNNQELYEFAITKYGSEGGLSETHHYETKEIKDSRGHLILPEGKVVQSDFTVTYWNNGSYVTPSTADTRTGIANYTYEVRLNDEKRSIYLLKREYLQDFLNDFRDIMVYGKSSQFVDDELIKTENTNITMP
tara:strand:+ start:1144 stop:1809 length:666 start_codon:yes stop_codon:yes gene_type:complete